MSRLNSNLSVPSHWIQELMDHQHICQGRPRRRHTHICLSFPNDKIFELLSWLPRLDWDPKIGKYVSFRRRNQAAIDELDSSDPVLFDFCHMFSNSNRYISNLYKES